LKSYNSGQNQIALSIVDSTVKANNTYEYFILPLDYYENEGIPSDIVTLPAFSFSKIFPPYEIKVTEVDSLGGLKISWKLDNKDKIISVKIFRSIYSDKDFTQIGEVNGLDSVYIDRTAEPSPITNLMLDFITGRLRPLQLFRRLLKFQVKIILKYSMLATSFLQLAQMFNRWLPQTQVKL
jgi:hypothetical protein